VTWPELTLSEWDDTRQTLQLWTQVVGKVRLALEPMVNHWWQVPLYVSARGLTTSLMHAGGRGLEIEFDFIHHTLDLRTSDGQTRSLPLEPRSVASFYEETMAAVDDLGVHVHVLARPVELLEAIPFARDTKHSAYDAAAAHRFWLALVQAHRVMTVFRGRFVGKASPVHFFWGSFDLAVTRFSGRPCAGPPRPDPMQQEAYSHEVISAGWWPGNGGYGAAAFYCYAAPVPDALAQKPIHPGAWDPALGEFILKYDEVRGSASPEGELMSFLETSYAAGADAAAWDRKALERPVASAPCG
jgi:hypothetical protein